MVPESSGNILADRRFALALQFLERGDGDSAADLVIQAQELAPGWPPFAFCLGEIYMGAGRRDDAVTAFTRYLSLDPEDRQGAIIKLALLGAAPKPKTLPAGYVESLFDQYAPRFDQSLVKELDYRVPWQLADIVEELKPVKPDTAERVLDLGCGTGLGGEAFARRAAWLEGVDISGGMLACAESKKLYQALHQDDLLSFLRNETKTYDLIIAADVFVYTGILEDVFHAIAARLQPGGLFAFSTQYLESGSFRLEADHRYAHSASYLKTCADEAGLKCRFLETTIIRKDGYSNIPGFLAVMAKPESPGFSDSAQPMTKMQIPGRRMRRRVRS